jgi:hypothetical protein
MSSQPTAVSTSQLGLCIQPVNWLASSWAARMWILIGVEFFLSLSYISALGPYPGTGNVGWGMKPTSDRLVLRSVIGVSLHLCPHVHSQHSDLPQTLLYFYPVHLWQWFVTHDYTFILCIWDSRMCYALLVSLMPATCPSHLMLLGLFNDAFTSALFI